MKFSGLAVIVLPILAGAFVVTAPATFARAGETQEYVIAANDGYGLQDCLSSGAECGQVVADAWCEAHGHGHALAYGLRSELDGKATPVSATDEPYAIRCGD